MSKTIIRTAKEEDAEQLLRIYAPYITDTAITFEYEVPTIDEFRYRINNTLKKYPYLVAEDEEGNLMGYAYAGAFKGRAAYDWTVETSIYVKQGEAGKGLGRLLHDTLQKELQQMGILNMCACISAPRGTDPYLTDNSIQFHSHLGYRLVGRFTQCGYKFSHWYDMVWMEKHIGEHIEKVEPIRFHSQQKKGLFSFLTLREKPELKNEAAEWFCSKWSVPKEAYLECMDAYLNHQTELGWYLCMDGNKIIGGLGVIENDFHDRKDLSPNVCAVYTEKRYRKQGIAGHLLNIAVDDLKTKGITPVYLVTNHIGFYERYGWEFLCMVLGDGEQNPSRMYIHK